MKLRALGAIGLALALVAGCSNEASTSLQDRPIVVVYGDSNIFHAYDEIKLELEQHDVNGVVHGVPGYRIADLGYWEQRISEYNRLDPAVYVVALGTNDTGSQAAVDAVPDEIDRLMEAMGDRPVVWITHVYLRPGVAPSHGKQVNEAIRAAADRWPNLTILDMTSDINEDPSLLGVDKLHFSAKGQKIYAAKIADVAEDEI